MISYSHSENFSVSPEGKPIALYLAEQWRQQGKRVDMKETSNAITISYMTINTLATMDEYAAYAKTAINNKEGK